MPQLIYHIDAIARKKGRDVLYLRFELTDDFCSDTLRHPAVRQRIVEWLNKNQVRWCECMDLSNQGWIIEPYRGGIYLDVPYDETDPDYQKLCAYLEHPDGSIRHKGVAFLVVPLSVATQHALKGEHNAAEED